MGIGRRQLVLASLVVALGAAVYLNQVFQGEGPLITTDTSTSDARLRTTQLVNGKGSSSTPKASFSASSTSSKAVEAAAKVDECFAETRLSHQKAGDTSMEILQKVLQDASTNDTVKKESLEKAAKITQNIVQKSNIESLVGTRGFSDCVVFPQNLECNIVICSDGLLPNETIAIKDIIGDQFGVAYNKIKIVEAK